MATRRKSRALFGRAPDLEYLSVRVRTKGLTAITGRPQAGKTWLLREFTDRLALDSEFLVGYDESKGQYPDLLRRALRDLYHRWLSDASYLDHARDLWRQNKEGWITRLGKRLGPALGKLFESTFQAPGAAKAVEALFDALHRADMDQRSGGIQLRTLDYDLAHDLLNALNLLTGGQKRAVLILDAFEQGEGARVEGGTLNSFVTNLDDWPESHILLALREPDANESESEALTVARGFAQASPAAVVLKLPDLHLEKDIKECDTLLYYLREKVPATKDLSDGRILELIGNYAGVIGRWVEAQKIPGSAPGNEADLVRIADDAHALRYREVDELLGKLSSEDRDLLRFAIRIALAPEMSTANEYETLEPILLEGMPASSVADLQSSGLLVEGNDNPAVPTYGHTKRYETARRLLCAESRNRPFAREEAQRLILETASQINSIDPEMVPYLRMLLGLGAVAPWLGIQDAYLGLCTAGASLFGMPLSSTAKDTIRESGGLARDHPEVALLVAMGLYNTLRHAKAENDLARRDALLHELRELARAVPDDRTVGEAIARGLFDTLNDAKDENHLPRRDALLDELRELGRAHPDDAPVREWLAKGLFNTLNHAKRENDLGRRDVLLDELRELSSAHLDDATVRKQVAMGLYNTLNYAKDENDLSRRDTLLDALRELATAHPDDAEVREELIKGLTNAGIHAVQEENIKRVKELLVEAWELLRKPSVSRVSENLRELLEKLRDGLGT